MDYVPIRVSTLRGDQKIDFNAYIKIDEKYILYLRRGDSFEGPRLARFKEKKVRKIFISQDEEQAYLTYLARNIEMAYDHNSKASLENRSAIIQGAQQANVEDVMENPGSQKAYEVAKDAAAKYAQFLMAEDKALTHIMNIENVDQNIAHHGVTVSTLSVALAKKINTKLNIFPPKTTQLLTLGGLLHDYGHFESLLSLNKPLHQFSAADLKTYKQHPMEGGLKVRDKKHFDQTVINIIAQHEECINGSGFPLGLSESKIDPLAVIVGTANALDRLITFEGVKNADAVKTLMVNSVGKYPLTQIQMLGDIMKVVNF
jgi:HD-GYP domain-containing protein (c-di-GMP phosphodiesterase class II)